MISPVILSETRTIGLNEGKEGVALVEYTTNMSLELIGRIREEYVRSKVAAIQSRPKTVTITKMEIFDNNDLEKVDFILNTGFKSEGYNEVIYFAEPNKVEKLEQLGYERVSGIVTTELSLVFLRRDLDKVETREV